MRYTRSALAGGVLLAAGCATLQQMAALRRVDFELDGVSGATLAGVPIDRVRNLDDLSASDMARIAGAVAGGSVPLAFELHLDALNPADNDVPARLLEMDWQLLIEDRETIGGRLDDEVVLEPGVSQDIPLGIEVDLADFFERGARDMIDLALAVTGGEARSLALRASPTIQTAVGPIRYPDPITIVSREVGGPGGF